MGRLNLDDTCTSTSLKTHAWVELRGLVDLGSAPPRSIPDTLTCSPLRSTNLTTGKEYLVGFKDAMRAAQCVDRRICSSLVCALLRIGVGEGM
ncbi:unnamed protein product [Fusarium graminearum]|nr:unnamed protein product [Fusarium graminearum]